MLNWPAFKMGNYKIVKKVTFWDCPMTVNIIVYSHLQTLPWLYVNKIPLLISASIELARFSKSKPKTSHKKRKKNQTFPTSTRHNYQKHNVHDLICAYVTQSLNEATTEPVKIIMEEKSRQCVKHAWLYSALLRASEGARLNSSSISPERI